MLSPSAPPDWARPPGTIAATPVNARNATSSNVTSSDVRSSVVSAAMPWLIRLSSSSVRSTMNQVTAEGRDEPQPERDEPDRAEAGDRRDRRQDDRLDRDAEPGLDRGGLVVEDLERPEQHRPEQGAGARAR